MAADLVHALTQEPPLGLMVCLLLQEAAAQLHDLLLLLSCHLQAVLQEVGDAWYAQAGRRCACIQGQGKPAMH